MLRTVISQGIVSMVFFFFIFVFLIDVQFQKYNSRYTATQGILEDQCSYYTRLSLSGGLSQDQMVRVEGAQHQAPLQVGRSHPVQWWKKEGREKEGGEGRGKEGRKAGHRCPPERAKAEQCKYAYSDFVILFMHP